MASPGLLIIWTWMLKICKTIMQGCRIISVSAASIIRTLTGNGRRSIKTTSPLAMGLPATMSAWQIHEYGGVNKLTLDTVCLPVLRRPEEVLVEIHAASLNNIDLLMLGGYGSKVFNLLRRFKGTLNNGSEFPLTLGKDFSGRIVDVGESVDRNKFQIGDEVWGAGNVAYPGTFAQYTAVSSNEISLKPKGLSHVEAGSMPYVIGTTWTAIHTVAQYDEQKVRGKRVLVLGASGGIGTFAVQLLRAWGANVTATCSTNAVAKVVELGAHQIVDYTQHDVWSELEQVDKFELIFDTIGIAPSRDHWTKLLNAGGTYVTIVTPVMRNVDRLGLLGGAARTLGQIAVNTWKSFMNKKEERWALFRPSGEAMHEVARLVDNGQIVPVVEKVFPFSELPAAFEKLAAKHSRGKTVINMK